MHGTDERAWMAEALDEARRALETGDVPVGAVVVARNGVVLGRGRNAREATGDPLAHAEVVALRAARSSIAVAIAEDLPPSEAEFRLRP